MIKPIRIGIVTGSASRLAGGLFNSVRLSARALSNNGLDVTILALEDRHSAEDLAEWSPLPLLTKPRGPSTLGYAPGIGEALRTHSFDIVHQHGIWQAFSAQVSAWRDRTRQPVMISPRGMLDQWALRNAELKKRLASALFERRNLASARCLHALTDAEAHAMRAFGLTNPIAVIPNGADVPAKIDLPPPSWWPGGKVLLFVGRIHRKKGILELIEAFAQLHRRAPHITSEWRVVIAGWDDGGHEAIVRSAIGRLGLADRVHLPGAIYGAEKSGAFHHAAAFALPSHSEGLPMSVLEAWAHALPVFMTDSCNLEDSFKSGAAARIESAPDALATSLEHLLSPAFRSSLVEMGRRGRELVQLEYGWDKIARHHAEVYQWMLGRAAAPPNCVRFA
jgi:poly(glycerol-phosphate) alpha-glucosyltransferase